MMKSTKPHNSWKEFRDNNPGCIFFVTDKSPYRTIKTQEYYVVFGNPDIDKKYGEFYQVSNSVKDKNIALEMAREMNEYPFWPKKDDRMIINPKYEKTLEEDRGRTVTVFHIQYNGTIVFEMAYDLPSELDENGEPKGWRMSFAYVTEFRPKNSI